MPAQSNFEEAIARPEAIAIFLHLDRHSLDPPTTPSLLPGYCNEWGAKMNTYLYIQIQIHTLIHTVICTNTDRIAISFFTSTTKALTPPYCPATVMSGGQKWMLRAKLWSPNNYLWSRFCKSQSKFKTNMYQYPVLILSIHTLDVVHLSNASILVSTGCFFLLKYGTDPTQ